jgi:hypothetical protein
MTETQSEAFIDMLSEIIREIKRDPKTIPVIDVPPKYRQVSLFKLSK